MLLAASKASVIVDVHAALAAGLDLSPVEPVSYVLGWSVDVDPSTHVGTIRHAQHIRDLAAAYHLNAANSVSTPMSVRYRLDDSSELIADPAPYASLAGSLSYADVSTRPDISVDVALLYRVMS